MELQPGCPASTQEVDSRSFPLHSVLSGDPTLQLLSVVRLAREAAWSAFEVHVLAPKYQGKISPPQRKEPRQAKPRQEQGSFRGK